MNINAYGLGIFNVDINLCNLAGGALCPLPQFQFSGGASLPIPESIITDIPSIAYTIPDLEALATIQLQDNDNPGQVVGCLQVTLSNGNTAYQSGVVWATVGLALLALFSSMLHSVIAKSLGAAQWRLIDVMMAIQNPAVISLLSLNYPNVYLQYGLNFAWSIGLVNIPSLQRSITSTRENTGGDQGALFGSNLTAFIATRLNPFATESGDRDSANSTVSVTSIAAGLLKRESYSLQPISSYVNLYPPSLTRRQQYAPNTGPGGEMATAGNNVTLPIVEYSPNNRGGIGTFAERAYVAPANAFLTVLVSMMILLAILVAALLVVYLIALTSRIITSKRNNKEGKWNHQLYHWSHRITKPSEFIGTITLATMVRFLMITFPIFFIFAFYQWAYSDSWVGHLVAAIFTVIFLLAAAGFLLPMIIHARREGSDSLYYNGISPAHASTTAKRWGQMAHMLRPKYYWFGSIFFLYWIIRACFISFAQGHGTRQAIGLLVLEVIFFLVLCIFRVGRDKKSDFIFILLSFTRVAAWAVCIAFIPSAGVETIPRVIVGFVLLVVTALPIVFLFFLTIWDLVMPLRRKHRDELLHVGGVEDEKRRSQSEMEVESSASSDETPPEQSNSVVDQTPPMRETTTTT